MTAWLERVASRLVRWHGREFAASYGDDLLETVKARSRRARQRGVVAFATFAIRETSGLLGAAIAHRVRPRWCSPSIAASPSRPSGEQVAREFRLAARRLLHAPTFSIAAILTLTLAIGATVSMFAMLWRIVLAPLPYPHADRLIALDHAAPKLGIESGMGMSIGLYREYAALPSIDTLAIFSIREGTLHGVGDAARTRFIQATPEIGTIAGLDTQLGRWFVAPEAEAGGPPVAVISDAMWRRDFGGDPGVLGRALRVDGAPHEIVGVLRPGAGFSDPRVQFFIPLPLPRVWTRVTGFNYSGVARLKADATVEQASREQNAVIAGIDQRYQADGEIRTTVDGGLQSLAAPLASSLVGDAATTLWALLGAAAVVFLMACANLANLFLVRHESRLREQAVHRALGAGAWNLAATIACETVIVSAIAGALAIILAAATVNIVVAYAPAEIPRLHELRIDSVVIMFAFAVSATAALACALLPLLRLWTIRPASLVSLERAPVSSASAMHTRHGLMAVQVTFAVLLLCVAALMTQSFRSLLQVNPGFEVASRLVFDINLPRSEYRSREDAAAFHTTLLDRLASIPGITAVSATSTLPLEGVGLGDPLEVRGRLTLSADATPMVRYRRVSNDYFAVMKIPLRAGRLFEPAEAQGRGDSAVIDEALARLYFGTADPIGQRIRPIEGDPQDRWLSIVGVVGNTATEGLAETSTVAKMYVPLRGSMWADVPSPHDMTYVAQLNGDPIAYISAVRTVKDELNPRLALARAEPLAAVLSRARASRAVTMMLLIAAAIVAGAVGTIGIYAVVSYAVAQRRAEIGVRIAMGATPSQVTTMIVRGSTAIVGAGIAAGVALSAASSRLIGALLFGVAPGDWTIHLMVAIGTLAVGALAASWPAWRAARINPMCALRG